MADKSREERNLGSAVGATVRERERSGLLRREGEEWRAATGESERALGWESQRWVWDGSHGGYVKKLEAVE
jgi:hypothetical protein